MPKIVNHEAKKQMIMNRSVESFLEKGIDGTRLIDIAKACEMGRTSIYQYFQNKEEIVGFTIQHLFKELREDIRGAVLEEQDDAYEKIRKLTSAIIQQYLKNKKLIVLVDLWLVLIRENSPLVKHLHDHMEESRKVFCQLLEEGIQQGVIRQMNPDSMAFTIYATIESLLLHMALHKERKVSDHIESLNILLDGLKA